MSEYNVVDPPSGNNEVPIGTRKEPVNASDKQPRPRKKYAKRAPIWQHFLQKDEESESEGWKRFCFNIFPLYKPVSKRTCSGDIVALYLEENAALKHLFNVEKQRVSFTTDIWTSSTTSCNYMVITAHWIDVQWKMQKRILSFKVVTDHKGETIAGQLLDCLDEWGIDKIFSVTVDNAKNNDKALENFKDRTRLRGGESLVCDGEFLHMHCCAHILNLIVGDGFKKANYSIVSIRNEVKHVRSSFSRLRSFSMRCETGRVCRGSLPLDVNTRWNSTYLMLSSALKLRVAFERMVVEDKLYCDYFEEVDEKTKAKRFGPPTSSDWDEAVSLVKFLKVFYKSTLAFSASKTVTSTLCYKEIVDIERNLNYMCTSLVEDIKMQAYVMRDKFEKYWNGLNNMNSLVIVGSVFDPRNKMCFASLCFDQLYGKGSKRGKDVHAPVVSAMESLYEYYTSRLSQPIDITVPTTSVPIVITDISDDDDGEMMDSLYSQLVDVRRNEVGCSELQIYLSEKTEVRVENALGLPYDVLSWWRCNSSKFPILSELARVILGIQVSSMASESAFSTSGRVLDSYRSSLTPYMVEVLICTQQWLRCSYKSEAQVTSLVQMLEEIDFLESLGKFN
ncbi:hypothetical protein CARUB_v10028251mg [Capsella rubella]|uniref:HAT C-terminal dimerisation domain-containing protein n=1 Tax=Capsella rubella TaxID=81985 RepID=R0EUF5_9BRAS|nr:hypothetical protein CARUB_v10028251mg [Capsella rubella]